MVINYDTQEVQNYKLKNFSKGTAEAIPSDSGVHLDIGNAETGELWLATRQGILERMWVAFWAVSEGPNTWTESIEIQADTVHDAVRVARCYRIRENRPNVQNIRKEIREENERRRLEELRLIARGWAAGRGATEEEKLAAKVGLAEVGIQFPPALPN